MSTPRRFSSSRQRRGIIAVQVALTLTALMALVALAADGGIMLAQRRRAQAAADAAALAAADDLYAHWYPTEQGVDGGTAVTSATTTATSNGYTSAQSPGAAGTCTVTVRVNPSKYFSGPNAGTTVLPGYAEVTITYYQALYFSPGALFGTSVSPISARAVARGMIGGTTAPAILLLDPTGSDVLTDKGGGNSSGLTVTGGSVVANSTSTSAVDLTGNGSVTAKAFQFTASSESTGNLVLSPSGGSITYNAPPTVDPLSYLPTPTQPTNGVQYTDTNGNKFTTGTMWTDASGNIYIPPGAYGVTSASANNFSSYIGNNANVYFETTLTGLTSLPNKTNVIYIASGGFGSNNVTYQMLDTNPSTTPGVMIYNASGNTTTVINMQGNSNSSVSWTAPTSGVFKGIAFFQDRNNTTSPVSLNGQANVNIMGTFYAANAAVTAGGKGSVNLGSQLIIKDLKLNGNGTTTVNYTTSSTGLPRSLQLVE